MASSGSNTPNGQNVSPPDLHGLWVADCTSMNGFSAYNMDANLNLEIGGGNIGNMAEAMQGFFGIMAAWRPDFETNATKLLGSRGMISSGRDPRVPAASSPR